MCSEALPRGLLLDWNHIVTSPWRIDTIANSGRTGKIEAAGERVNGKSRRISDQLPGQSLVRHFPPQARPVAKWNQMGKIHHTSKTNIAINTIGVVS